jgi:hypothetical protein
MCFLFRWVDGFVVLFVLFSLLLDPLYGGIGGFRGFGFWWWFVVIWMLFWGVLGLFLCGCIRFI